MGVYLTVADLAVFAAIDPARAEAMIADAEAQAALVAPCLSDGVTVLTEVQRAAVKGILRRAVLRWHEAGNAGTRTSHNQTAGPFGVQETFEAQGSKGLFWPSEVSDLQGICKQAGAVGLASAFSIDTAPGGFGGHQPWCSLMFLAIYCSCGADLNRGEPLYEGGLLS